MDSEVNLFLMDRVCVSLRGLRSHEVVLCH